MQSNLTTLTGLPPYYGIPTRTALLEQPHVQISELSLKDGGRGSDGGGGGGGGTGVTPSSFDGCQPAVLENCGIPILTLEMIGAPTSNSTTKTMTP